MRARAVLFATAAVMVAALPVRPDARAADPPLVAGYGFDEGAGGTAGDASGHGLIGSLVSGPTWVAGRYGTALNFNGTDQYVNLANPTALRLTGSMTISGWINSSAFPGDDAAVVSKRGVDGYQLDTTIDRGPRTIGFKLTNSAGGDMIRYGATAMQANTWYHIAGVYNAATATMDVYLNGQLDNGPLVGTVTTSQRNSTQNVNIGRRSGGGFGFIGRIDDVRIYDRVLTVGQVQADMATSVTGTTPPDLTPPTASITAPATGAQVADIITVTATAADNIGVAGVQFLVDGNPTGLEDTSAPYGLQWDTRNVNNGAHTLTARARDTAGNTTTSTGVNVNVANTTPPPSTLVAGYGFDEGAGGTAGDASGHGLIGSLVSGPTWVAGRYGTALNFNGTDQYVNLANPTALRLTGSMTISGWINSSAFPGDDAAVVSKRGVDGYQLDTTIDRGPRTIGFKLTNSAGGDMIRYGATAMQANTWYHIAGVYNAATATMDVYLNGQLDNGPLVGTVTTSQRDSTQNVNIGRRSGGGFGFIGRIDDVRIYDRVLTVGQVQADMATSVTGTTPPDLTPPTVSITAPASGAQVADIITVTATAADNIGVAGVQFLVDGNPTGLEDTVRPLRPAMGHPQRQQRRPHPHRPRPRHRRQHHHLHRRQRQRRQHELLPERGARHRVRAAHDVGVPPRRAAARR